MTLSTPASTDAELRAYYAARAREYDRVYLKPERQADIGRVRDWLTPLFEGLRLAGRARLGRTAPERDRRRACLLYGRRGARPTPRPAGPLPDTGPDRR